MKDWIYGNILRATPSAGDATAEDGGHTREAEFHLEGHSGADFLIPLCDQAKSKEFIGKSRDI